MSKRWIALGFINQGQSTTAQDELLTAREKDELYLSSIRACIDRPRNSACSDMTTLPPRLSVDLAVSTNYLPLPCFVLAVPFRMSWKKQVYGFQ